MISMWGIVSFPDRDRKDSWNLIGSQVCPFQDSDRDREGAVSVGSLRSQDLVGGSGVCPFSGNLIRTEK